MALYNPNKKYPCKPVDRRVVRPSRRSVGCSSSASGSAGWRLVCDSRLWRALTSISLGVRASYKAIRDEIRTAVGGTSPGKADGPHSSSQPPPPPALTTPLRAPRTVARNRTGKFKAEKHRPKAWRPMALPNTSYTRIGRRTTIGAHVWWVPLGG